MEEESSQNSSLQTQEETLGLWEQKTVGYVIGVEPVSLPLPTTCKVNAITEVLHIPDCVLEYFGYNYMRKGESPTTNTQPSATWRELETKSTCSGLSLLLIVNKGSTHPRRR